MNCKERNIVYKVPETVKKKSIENVKEREKIFDYLRQNGLETTDNVNCGQSEITSELRGNICVYLMLEIVD